MEGQLSGGNGNPERCHLGVRAWSGVPLWAAGRGGWGWGLSGRAWGSEALKKVAGWHQVCGLEKGCWQAPDYLLRKDCRLAPGWRLGEKGSCSPPPPRFLSMLGHSQPRKAPGGGGAAQPAGCGGYGKGGIPGGGPDPGRCWMLGSASNIKTNLVRQVIQFCMLF